MTHAVQIIDSRQLSDGELALLAECCGQKSTHSWLTMAASVVTDDAQYQDSVNFHCQRVALQHESMLQALAKLTTILGTTTMVTFPAPAQPVNPVTPDPTPAPTAPSDPSTSGGIATA
jgi:hypothetical protein